MTKSSKKINVKERVDDDTIDLSLSDIVEVPVKEMAVFKRAVNVDLSCNKIVSLGDNFGLMLVHLVKLDLSKNQLRELPASFGKLVNLKHLDLYRNELQHLPLEMGQLRNLRYLDLKSNPLKSGVEKIVGQCLTVKECQLAAKRIVPFLADMQVQIREERQRMMRAKEERDAELERRRLEQIDEPAADDQSNGPVTAPTKKPKPKRERKRKEPEIADGQPDQHNVSVGKTNAGRHPAGSRSIFRLPILSTLFVLLAAVALTVLMPVPRLISGAPAIPPYSLAHLQYALRAFRREYTEPAARTLIAGAKQTVDLVHELLASWAPA